MSSQVSRTPTLTNDSPPAKEKPPSSSSSSSSIIINGRIETPRPDSDKTKTETRGDSEIALQGDVEGALYASLSPRRKLVLLGVFCSAQFFDVFNASAVLVSLPSLGADLHFTPGALQWILSAYTLTFASFMLVAGTLADIFHPKPIFCLGFAFVGVFNIPVGASVHPVMAIVFRALQGIGAAMNVPSGIAMIRTTFPDPVERSAAYASYALAATVGNISGFVVGGVLTARTSWRWVHYLCAIMVIPMSVVAWFLLPAHTTPPKSERRSVDIPGVLTLTAGLILFVYAISDAVDAGWASPQVITTLILSLIAFIAFFVIESVVAHPALPPRTWRNKNFTPLFFYALSPYWWCLGCELQLVSIFLNLWHDSPLIDHRRAPLPAHRRRGRGRFLPHRARPALPPREMGPRRRAAAHRHGLRPVRAGGHAGPVLGVCVSRDGGGDARAGECVCGVHDGGYGGRTEGGGRRRGRCDVYGVPGRLDDWCRYFDVDHGGHQLPPAQRSDIPVQRLRGVVLVHARPLWRHVHNCAGIRTALGSSRPPYELRSMPSSWLRARLPRSRVWLSFRGLVLIGALSCALPTTPVRPRADARKIEIFLTWGLCIKQDVERAVIHPFTIVYPASYFCTPTPNIYDLQREGPAR